MLAITPAGLQERKRAGELWQLLDVREPWEIRIASVPDAMLIPMHEVAARIGELDAAESIAVLCHTGVRSARVAGWLLARGFTIVANIEGGIDAWSKDVDGSIRRY